MNFRTTLILLVLVAAGAAFWFGPALFPKLAPSRSDSDSQTSETGQFLQHDLSAEKIQRIKIQHADREVVLKKGKGGDWTLPGDWPARKKEVEELVHLLAGLNSRFATTSLGSVGDLKTYGLAKPPVVITVDLGQGEHRLAFGEESGDSNRFSRPTYVRLDDKMEVVRLAPGIVDALDRPADHYQQRRLFPSERVAKDTDSQEKVERLTAKSISAKDAKTNYSLEKAGDDWEIREPVRDHADPDKLKTILSAVPDVWAEQFVDKPKSDLAEYGLKDPQETISVVGANGEKIKLLIGKQSQVKTRTVTRPAPNIGGPPMPPQQEVVHDEFRYAKLDGNPQIFEIKADKLKDIFSAADTLRDARLARFRTEDARKVEIIQGNQTILLSKEKDRWKLQKPMDVDAETSKITELLDKLSGLQARDKDVLDKADAKAYGLDKPVATVKVTVEEEGKGDTKTKKTKTFAFDIGKHDTEQSKVYVSLEGIPRINAVEESLLKLVERPALAYRSRRVLDHPASELAKIEVKRENGPYTLEQVKDSWRLAAPAQADIDAAKVSTLANDLARLEAVEYVSERATPDALDRLYGLGKPSLSAQITFTDAKKPAQTLQIGKQREGKPEYFARLTSAPSVFVVKKELRDALDQDSLALRPLQLWQLTQDNIKELKIQKDDPQYRLLRDGQTWKIAGPFDAPAVADTVKPMTEELSNPRCERYVAHSAKDLTTYGLDKPYLRASVLEAKKDVAPNEKDKPKDKAAKPESTERTLIIGKPVDKDGKTRFAKLGDSDAVFVVGEKLVTAIDHRALDLLNRDLLTLDSAAIEKIRSEGTGGTLTIQRQGNEWRVLDSPAAPFPADTDAMAAILGVWSNLKASRYAAYGPKLDLAAYGLDKPDRAVTVTLKTPSGSAAKTTPAEHRLVLGKAVQGSSGEHFARLDDGPGVVVLAANMANELTHGYLDFVNRSALKLDAAKVTGIDRTMGKDAIEIVRKDGSWHLTKPAQFPADGPTLDGLVAQLAALRAKRVAAYPAKDLKPFGLDAPTAIVTIRGGESSGKPGQHTIKIGKAVDPARADRFAQVDDSTAIVVLPDALSRDLVAADLHFRDRNLAHVGGIDRVVLARGSRKATFAKSDGTWKLTQPLESDAESFDLDDFTNAVARLRADELVAEKPRDLQSYGLERPDVHWKFQSGDKIVLDLLVGNAEKSKSAKSKDEERRYAKLANSDLIFLLSPAVTTKALAEYRSRSLWASLDASQIDKLHYGYPHDPFTLEKIDSEWRVAGQPRTKVKADTIREALDALAGLKAVRYVADKGADLKLYGLEPPQCVLEIQTPTGKRVLHIGRPEGESKRLYARVPEGDKSDAIFVISDNDAARIVRPVGAFFQNGAKVSASRVP